MTSDKLLLKEIELVAKHEANLTECKEIQNAIQKKVSQMMQRLKDEEMKLLEDIEDFERTEIGLLNETNKRLKEMEMMSKYGTLARNILMKLT
jgi:trans-2-enoyl-CoA reductase